GQLRLSRWSIAECHLVRADSQITAKNIAQKPVGGNEAFAIPLEVESRRPLMLLGRQSLPNAIEQAGFHVQPSPPNMDFPFLEWHRIWRFSPNSRSFQILRKSCEKGIAVFQIEMASRKQTLSEWSSGQRLPRL